MANPDHVKAVESIAAAESAARNAFLPEDLDLSGAHLVGARLGMYILHNTDFSGATLERVSLVKSELAGSNFSESTLKEVNFSSVADIEQTFGWWTAKQIADVILPNGVTVQMLLELDLYRSLFLYDLVPSGEIEHAVEHVRFENLQGYKELVMQQGTHLTYRLAKAVDTKLTRITTLARGQSGLVGFESGVSERRQFNSNLIAQVR